MAQEPGKNPIPDYDALVTQLQGLRDEVARLAGSVSGAASSRGQALADEIRKDLGDARQYVGRKGHEVDLRIGQAVAANPYMALGLAAGLGLVMGLLSRR